MMIVFTKKRGKNASFFINPTAQDVKKMMSRIMWKKLINPLNHLKQMKNWNLFQQIPGNFQNITPNMPIINTSVLYWKDNLDGHSSNDILTIDVFMKKSFF